MPAPSPTLAEMHRAVRRYILSLDVCCWCRLLTDRLCHVALRDGQVLPEPVCVSCLAALQDLSGGGLTLVTRKAGKWIKL